ncbi:hypothetical protein CO051_05380 [Candidatus Roizmanbacteria bacterium CG_4_9_14_0_2_um_filter_39_13]|uniref:Uncharacterized protein n=2 Tax=Candidatus Roizmaniibacteriota TaxID=1752723 RepID=A0A2M8EX99_9BACT|nr:MAG: hypothetical protein COY15_01135 [Candidatus Roizmanbacteria bacterium CG_4_10_14_0_2_um_filter_39_12]PJC30492.1 MAG: hypothetical protein CO051_05380 [Candidatus Roizmanbacteria bacterium CG_4_9_14_0_2_um_filter_39_13]PJE62009.1 MAG: hypothetical protein COU87_01515 [Candidatus Roizmanbacteria bacterium CG10_big_fil_rev_8_21_14_0_10_39_12]
MQRATLEELLQDFDGQCSFDASAITSAFAKTMNATLIGGGLSRLDYYSHVDREGRTITLFDATKQEGSPHEPIPTRVLEGYYGALNLIDRAFQNMQ